MLRTITDTRGCCLIFFSSWFVSRARGPGRPHSPGIARCIQELVRCEVEVRGQAPCRLHRVGPKSNLTPDWKRARYRTKMEAQCDRAPINYDAARKQTRDPRSGPRDRASTARFAATPFVNDAHAA